MRVLVTGGTGRLGRHVVTRDSPHSTWRVLSRRPSSDRLVEHVAGDLVTGDNLSAALEGVDAVLHLASNPRRPADDVQATRHLLDASEEAGVRHLVYVSIIGVDRIPYAYYEAKWVVERMVMAGRTPWTILRAAQFHSFVDLLLGRAAARFPVVFVVPAGFSVQSVADAEVADRLIDVLAGGPTGRLPDFAGPEILRVSAAARTWAELRRVRKPVVPVPIPGAVARAFRTGANTSPDADRGRTTWREWLSKAASVTTD